jgi:hypothetical protein
MTMLRIPIGKMMAPILQVHEPQHWFYFYSKECFASASLIIFTMYQYGRYRTGIDAGKPIWRPKKKKRWVVAV